MRMQIGKWGNSLAVRLPREIVEKFDLKEGDAIDSERFEDALRQTRLTREQALERVPAAAPLAPRLQVRS